MFEESLIEGAKENLALLGRSGILKDAYLAGGTAAALQLGHRISVDFDFFTTKEFVPKSFSTELSELGSFDEEQADKGMVLGKFEGVNFSLFVYKYPLIYPPLKYLSLNVADIRDIAAMKIDAVATRGRKRDFIDLYFMCKSGYELTELLDFYDKRYGKLASNLIHINKSLVFFNDAEPDEMPRLLKEVKWEEVKRCFECEVKKLFR
ncbi:nucleotidyl transferase AbiEii/AbiGii toxin family protein [candidate division NPL-UPA2 bacterium]|nr:nucleotidyl transferase AbiEii/AbiGii toxin family protein [candidate division NPL-UPA2 bacterium]